MLATNLKQHRAVLKATNILAFYPAQLQRIRYKGQSLVEFAMILPMTLCLVLGIIEVGYALYGQHVVTKLTREGSNLISRDTTLQDAATAMNSIANAPVDFNSSSRLIFSVIKKVATTGTQNYDKEILYQRYVLGSLSAQSALRTKGSGSFGGAPNYVSNNSDNDTNLQLVNLPPNLAVARGGMIYVTEIYTRHSLITPFDKFGLKVPTTLYSVAYF